MVEQVTPNLLVWVRFLQLLPVVNFLPKVVDNNDFFRYTYIIRKKERKKYETSHC